MKISSNLICRRMKRVCTSIEEESREGTLSTYHQMLVNREKLSMINIP